jgi:glycosyltransferase involved in cell wall biosynthesis
MIKVLHLTAHLGGGVGKALSGLVLQAVSSGSDIKHTFVTLEEQEKPQFIELIQNFGCEVIICPATERLHQLIEASDILQLEWWNHPLTLKTLCSQPLPPMRLLVWSHVSGLYNPIIPNGLIQVAQRFLFTSPCSYESKELSALSPMLKEKTCVVSSSGGFSGFPFPCYDSYNTLEVGYIGSLNFAKLHPRFVDYLSEVKTSNFKVRLIGDIANKDILEEQCLKAGRSDMLEFRGYTNNVASELASINVLAYLLNPVHYGTTENALIEAMSMGIVPIVLNNPAERHIVEDHETGLIVSSPKEFAEAVGWLSQNPDKRRLIGRQAAESVRTRFSGEKMAAAFDSHYLEIMSSVKQHVYFADIFGSDPADWFLSCQGDPSIFSKDGTIVMDPDSFLIYGLLERTKGTVLHFHKYFQKNLRLSQWARTLESYINNWSTHE